MELLEGKDPHAYLEMMTRFRETLISDFGTMPFRTCDAFREVFESAVPEEGSLCLTVTNADLNLDNVFCSRDRYLIIDYEWIFPFLLPLGYLLYRAMLLDPTFVGFSEEDKRTILAGLSIEETERALYERMEMAFLAYISPDIYKLDYFARMPGAQLTKVYDFSVMVENQRPMRLFREGLRLALKPYWGGMKRVCGKLKTARRKSE